MRPHDTTTRRPLLLLASVVLFAAMSSVLAGTAAAHAALVEMSPGVEMVLDSRPEEVRLTFNEGVSATADAIRVFDPSAQELTGVVVEQQGREVVADLPELGAVGSYTVAWRVISSDGHPIRGAYLFHLGEATLTEPVDAGLPAGSGTSDVFRAVGAVLALAALAFCLGVWVLGNGATRAPAWWALRWVPVVAGTTLLFGGSVVAVGSSLTESLESVVTTASGRMAVLAVVFSVAGLVVSAVRVAPRAEVVLALFSASTIALQGHAVSLPPVALSAGATLVHVLAAVVWAAGLLWLERRSRTAPPAEVRADVERLSPWGMGMVVALAVTGALLVLDRVPFGELLSSDYGRLGLVKVAVLVVAVPLAWRNRRTAQRAEEASQPVGRSQDEEGSTRTMTSSLRSGVRAEMAVLGVALIVGAVLAQVPPPDGGTAGLGGGLFIERQAFGQDGQVEVTFDPGERGVNEVHVVALSADGRLMAEADELSLALELPSEDVGPIEPEMQRISGGHSSAFVRVPLEGEWRVTVTSRVDRFTELTAQFRVPIGP